VSNRPGGAARVKRGTHPAEKGSPETARWKCRTVLQGARVIKPKNRPEVRGNIGLSADDDHATGPAILEEGV